MEPLSYMNSDMHSSKQNVIQSNHHLQRKQTSQTELQYRVALKKTSAFINIIPAPMEKVDEGGSALLERNYRRLKKPNNKINSKEELKLLEKNFKSHIITKRRETRYTDDKLSINLHFEEENNNLNESQALDLKMTSSLSFHNFKKTPNRVVDQQKTKMQNIFEDINNLCVSLIPQIKKVRRSERIIGKAWDKIETCHVTQSEEPIWKDKSYKQGKLDIAKRKNEMDEVFEVISVDTQKKKPKQYFIRETRLMAQIVNKKSKGQVQCSDKCYFNDLFEKYNTYFKKEPPKNKAQNEIKLENAFSKFATSLQSTSTLVNLPSSGPSIQQLNLHSVSQLEIDQKNYRKQLGEIVKLNARYNKSLTNVKQEIRQALVTHKNHIL